LDFDNRWFGSCTTSFHEQDSPRRTGTPDAWYLEVAGGTLIWHADEYRLIYDAPYAPGGPKYRNTPGKQASFHERAIFLAVCLVLMATFGVWTGARSIAQRALMARWEGTRPGDYTLPESASSKAAGKKTTRKKAARKKSSMKRSRRDLEEHLRICEWERDELDRTAKLGDREAISVRSDIIADIRALQDELASRTSTTTGASRAASR